MAVSSARIVNGLADAGHDVLVIHLTSDPASLVVSGEKISAGSMNPVLNQWQTCIRTGINGPSETEMIYWKFRKKMSGSVLVGFGGNFPGYLATLWAKWLNGKSAVLFRGNDFEKGIHDIKRSWMVHFVLQQADVVGAVSNEMKTRIECFREKTTCFTPNSIDATAWSFLERDEHVARTIRKERFPDNAFVLGLFGELKSKKGLDLAMELASSVENVYLMVVGSIPESMEEKPEEYERLIRFPFQHREVLPAFYAAADVVLIPSYYDGMPNVLLEAMALGKIVIAGDAGGIPDVVTDSENGFLFEAGDGEAARRILKTVMTFDPGEKRRIENNARKTIETRFQLKQEIDIIEKMLS